MTEFAVFTLDYSSNLLQNYQKLAKLPGFVLLESSDKTRGRYDILSAYPYERVKFKPDSSDIKKAFEYLQHLILSPTAAIDLPFQGGAIGYFSYDFGAVLAGINSSSQPSLQEMPLIDIGLYDWGLITDHLLKKVTLFSANSRPETSSIIEEILSRWHKSDNEDNCFILYDSFSPIITKSAYQDAFNAIYQDLQQGRCYQVNYTQPFHAHYVGEPWEMYKRVRSKNPVPYSAFLRSDQADILSFSPERFLTYDKRHLLASPIKGTTRRGANHLDDDLLRKRLLESGKNRAENIMIVDLLRNDLGRIAKPGTVEVTSLCEIQSYASVHHLVSHIEAWCAENVSPVQAFQTCFPGGSITGAPKLESMRIIAEQETYARGVYCGSIGYFSRHGRFDSNIAIRTVTAKNEILHLAAGGGIVIDSCCEDEYLECFTKIAAIVNGLK